MRCSKGLLITAAAAAALLFSLVSCSTYRHCQWRVGDQSKADTEQYALRFIEADDEGWLWDRRQADSAMQLIRSRADAQDTIVVVFVHGWHHSAQCCDHDVEGFRNTLANLQEYLARHRLTTAKFNVIGVYVGWRGRSLMGLLDYLTFWGRKGAAERIGENDLKEFMARLQALFVKYRPDAQRVQELASAGSSEPDQHFLGLVTIGHSFGAQVLLKAITAPLEDQLEQLNGTAAYLRDAVPGTPSSGPGDTVIGMGDLVVLINPAAEASQYQRLHVLSRGLTYSPLQTPLVLTVSAENDNARHRFFTAGRALGEFFTGKPRKANRVERTVERQALGVYRGQITHRLVPVDPDVELIPKKRLGDSRNCNNGGKRCESEWREWKKPPTVTKPNTLEPMDSRLRTFDFSKEVIFSNVELSPLTPQAIAEWNDDSKDYATAIPYQPFIVARASKKIIDNHSGIFTQPFLNFLVPYIANIETKSALNRQAKQKLRTEESQEAKKLTSDSGSGPRAVPQEGSAPRP